jgi:tetratricopeptide (TPR) repeat protein
MKRQSIKGLALIAVTGAMVTSCDLLKDLEYKVTPNPLEMHGDSVRVKVDVTFPEKGIKKKAKAEITPMLGSTALKPVTVLGEKATGNGNTIQYKPGGKVSYEDVVPYKAEYENADLKVTGKVYKGDKEKEGQFEETKIADATIITPYLVNKDFRVIFEKDQFRRVTEETTLAQINYEKGKSNVRPAEMKDADVTALQNWLAAAQANPKINIKSINVVGYASPEGEEDKNNTLSTERSEAGKKATMEISKKAKNDKGQTEIYSLAGRGEDFTGFKRELEKSAMNADERNLIIRVLEMNSDPATRETEMRNMGKTFTYLDKNIFPLLRRSEMIVTYDLTGYSDEELKAIAASTPDSLNLEELLFTATLVNDLNDKLKIYQVAAKNYADDYRTHNNVGAVLYMQNKMSEAKAAFEKSMSVKDNAIAKNNLGAIAGTSGDRAKAKQLLTQAKGAGSEVSYNWGIINIQDGKYADAVSNFGSEASFNKGLAQTLNGSNADATKTIDASKDKETAQGYYLKAVIAARDKNVDGAVNNLKSAFAKDGSLKAKAAKDREFLKFAENAAFSAIVK